jgi:aminoglycoside phosphotransferase (APT) family kinase protein
VPEPLAYLGDPGVLLMRAAQGDPLRYREGGWPAFEEGLRRAAHWLAALQASPLRLGSREHAAHDASRLAARAKKAAACRPELEGVFRSAMEELDGRRAAVAKLGEVQTHGRYHAEHVFLAPECVTVIDLDRAALGDPMKDVGEFLHRLRWQGAREGWGGEALEESSAAFLAEYSRVSPVHLSRLTYYWSYSILWTLLGLACKGRAGEGKRQERSRFLQAEFALVPERAAPFRISGRMRPTSRRSQGRPIPPDEPRP